jgi:hypothetical protein
VTIFDYGTASNAYDPAAATNEDRDDTESQTGSQAKARAIKSGDNAIILSVRLKTSLLAIGPNHLALALDNGVRFSLLRPPASVNKPVSLVSITVTPTMTDHFSVAHSKSKST